MNPRSRLLRHLLPVLMLAAGCQATWAQAQRVEILPPDGLVACSPTSALSELAQKGLSQIGQLIGCFVSDEQVRLQATPKEISEPLEYAFVVVVAPSAKPYAASDVQDRYAKVGEQWKDHKPLDQQAPGDYARQLEDIVARGQPRIVPLTVVQLAPPILVSIEHNAGHSYVVTTIRQRRVVQGDQAFITTAVDATAITLRSGSLLRLSITRELLESADVDKVHKAIQSWIASVGSAPKRR